MLRSFKAKAFVKPADRGGNRPLVLRGRSEESKEELLYVKTRAGYGDRPSAPGIELFTTLLAREMNLLVPEPVLIEIPEGFERFIFDAPEHRELVRQSAGVNFATVALGADWKTWPIEMSPRAFPADQLENILVFDALVQNTDREPDNPNLMWRGRQVAALDFEKCFGYLRIAGDVQRPWRDFLLLRPLQRHCLRQACSNVVDGNFGRSAQEQLIGLDLENRFSTLAQEVCTTFPEARLDLERISEYFGLLTRNTADFFEYLRATISQ